MKAGVDFGSTLVKAFWIKNGEQRFSSTADVALDDIVRQLRDDGVRQVHRAGIGYSDVHADYFKRFEVKKRDGDPIENEVRLQAEGTRRLLRECGDELDTF